MSRTPHGKGILGRHRHTKSVQRFLNGGGTTGMKDGTDRRQLKRYTAKRRRSDDQDHIDEQLVTITKFTADFPLRVTLDEVALNAALTLGKWLTTWEERFAFGCLRLDLVHHETGHTAVADFFAFPEFARARVISPEREAVTLFIATFQSFTHDGDIPVHQADIHAIPREENIRRCGHDHDPGDKVCGECGAQLWSREDYESEAP